MSRSLFEVLGVERRYHLTPATLEAHFLERSKQFHPDRFAKAAPRERLQALQRTTELNDAYRVLKNELKRAEYLLKLEGIDVADEKSSSVKASPALLMAVMERNEALAEARQAGDDARVQALAAEVRAERAVALGTVDERFTALEAGGEPGALRAEIAQALIAVRYHARFLEQIDAYEEGKRGAEL